MNAKYQRLNESILDQLREIVGKDNVFTSAEDREKYSHDEVTELHIEPEAVVKVCKAEDVCRILKLAQQAGFPVTPRGAGQGLSGGCVPAMGGVAPYS